MQEQTAESVVRILRGWDVAAHVARVGAYRFGVRVVLGRDTEAIWDTDGAAGLEAQVLRNGVLVGYVPVIPGSEQDLSDEQVAELIGRADYSAAG